MAKYEKRVRPGWVFYHENEAVFEAMDAEECKAVVLALNKYSRQLSDGALGTTLDISSIPTKMGQGLCRMIAERILQDATAYSRRCEQSAANRNKKKSTTVDDGQPQSTTVDDSRPQSTNENIGRPIDINIGKHKETKHKETKHKEVVVESAREALPSPAADDEEDDLAAQIAAHQRADDLIRRYRMPDADPTREALLEDAEAVGWTKLEETLRQAAISNSRQMVSVSFYRSILHSTAKGGRMNAADPYSGYSTL